MTRRSRKPKRLPLPKGMPPRPASDPPKAEHWLDRHERERDEMDEALRLRIDADGERLTPRRKGHTL